MSADPLQPFLDHLAHERGLSPRTVSAYGRDVRAFLETARERGAVDGADLRGLDDAREVVRVHLARLRREGKQVRSVDRELAAVRCFYRFLETTGVVAVVPAVMASCGPREEDHRKPLNVVGSGSSSTRTWIRRSPAISDSATWRLPTTLDTSSSETGNGETSRTVPRRLPNRSRSTGSGATWILMPDRIRLPSRIEK